MQWVLSRIWTRVAVFISYDDNNYTTGTSGIMDKMLDYQLIPEFGGVATVKPVVQ